ncbi:MAG: ATP-binding protein [Gracilibacteraceae bacterium]|jgi:predicted AAA+ superfamily ATPase|nr:ATP-binding protein [Gracilibacteraceae bacterium]
MRLVHRPQYLAWLNDWRDKPVIKVVTGVRRCGKSTLFKLYIDSLLERGVKQEQIVSINLEELEYEQLTNYRELYAYLKARLFDGGATYVFIDEVQQCRGFEKAVDSLFVKGKADVHITGSNAFLLSGELATLLSGRYVQIEMLPLSFAEYCDFQGGSGAALFRDYLRFGAFPAVAALGDDAALVRSYLDGVYSSILVKDVARREKITDLTVLENIVKFLLSNIGSPVSLKKIADALKSAGRTISVNTVDKYVHALCAAYLFYKCDRYDVKGKTLLKTHSKYYAVDSGLRELLLASSAGDIGHILENTVYLELLRRGGKVRLGKVAEKEVDFVCATSDGLAYYQVSATVLEENTLRRELEPLQRIADNHPKYLLTLDEIPRSANYDGIRQVHLVDWLLGK